MSFPFAQLPTMEWTSLGSFLASVVLLRALIQQYLPPEFLSGIKKFLERYFGALRRTIIIEENDSYGGSEAYNSALRYLSHKFSQKAPVVMLSKSSKSKNYTFTVGTNQNLQDHFDGIKVDWSFRTKEINPGKEEIRYLDLSFDPKFSQQVRDFYLPHLMAVAAELECKQRVRKLYTNRAPNGRGCCWTSVNFDHPATFETLAMDPQLKATLVNDLKKFLKNERYCKRVGRTWKRGYLLYGPPGTGKTSLIAAIANFLEFDIYDMELTAVNSNLLLRRLLIETRRKSVIVIEDIDCSLQLSDRSISSNCSKSTKEGEEETKVNELSLSGVLNFMDGLWSCCGEERLMIFTTNYKERLDPALLRAGRMDMHVHLSYCGVPAFRQLVKNYLCLEEGNGLMTEIEKLLVKVEASPADIAEQLMGSEYPDVALNNVLAFLNERLRRTEVENGEDSNPQVVN